MAGNHPSEEAHKLTATRRHTLKLAAGTAIGSVASSTSVTAQAAAEGSTVYAGRGDGLHAVNVDTGTDEWVFDQESGFIYSSPTVAEGTVYIGGQDETLYAIDAATGQQKWAYTEPSHEIRSSPTVVDGTVFVGGSPFGGGTVHAVDAATGKQQWTFTEPEYGAHASPNVVDGAVYISGNAGTIYSIDAETGEERWSYSFADAQVHSRPTVADGTVYIGSDGFRLIAIDADSGEKQWSSRYPGSGVISAPTVVDGTVYAGAGPYNDAGPLYAVDTASGETEWEFPTPDGIAPYGGPTVSNGIVYVGTVGGELYAVDAETGDQEWIFSTPSRSIKSGPTVFDNTVYFVTEVSIYAVDAVTCEQEWVLDTDGGSRSSPTIVQNPEGGNSVGSRVNLGTLGHHHVWAEEAAQQPSIVFQPTEDEVGVESELTYDIVVEDAVDGVSAYEFTATIGDIGVASITDAELVAFGGEVANIDVAADGSSVFFEEAVEDADPPGDPFTIARVTVTADETEGTTQLSVADDVVIQNNDGAEYEFDKVGTAIVAVVEEVAPDVTGNGEPAQDLDEDGLYEDINGDGSTDVFDVQALWNNKETDAVQDNTDLFDFAGGGDIDIFDVQALFNQT